MFSPRQAAIIRAQKLADLLVTIASFIGAYFLKKYIIPEPFRGLPQTPNYYVILLMIVIIWYVLIDSMGDELTYRPRSFYRAIWQVVKLSGTGMLVLGTALFVFKIPYISRILIGVFFSLNIFLLSLRRLIGQRWLDYYRKKGFLVRNVLLVGSRERAKTVLDAVGKDSEGLYKVMGCLDTDSSRLGLEVGDGVRVIGRLEDLPNILREQIVDVIVFAMPLSKIENAGYYMSFAEEVGVEVRIMPDWQIHALMYRPRVASIQVESFVDIPVLSLVTTPRNQGALLAKNALDYVVASLALIVLSPVMAVISAAIYISSKGPVLFEQERCGLNGRRFMLYKFRTMVPQAERRRKELQNLNEADGPVFKIRNDPRIIPYVGTFLRKTSLDELPQLINVLKGEMSLVGPRPPVPAEVSQYEDSWRRRLSMKPGLTCLWQSSPLRNDMRFDDWMRLDLEYIDKWSFWLDLRIMLRTATVVLCGQGR